MTGYLIHNTPIRDPRTGMWHVIRAPYTRYNNRIVWTRCAIKINVKDAAQRVYDLPKTDCPVCFA